MTIIIALAELIFWLGLSRMLFRYWVRTDTLMIRDYYNDRVPMPHWQVAPIAMLTAILFPIALVYLAVTWDPPQGKMETQEKIRSLEAENKQLRGL